MGSHFDLVAPNARWTKLRNHAVQQQYWRSTHRFNVVPAGRRSGKTELAKRRLVKRALNAACTWDPRFFAAAPTRDQAKGIYWEDLKKLVGPLFTADKSETELSIKLINGAELKVLGMDKPERIEGPPWDGGILDEYGNMKEHVWPAHVRPALADRNGWCDFIGVPEGRNHYYHTNKKALENLRALGANSEWASYTWPSRDILPASEIESAMRDLDDLTFDQEFNASFVSFEGRAYYPFTEATHCSAKLRYDPKLPLDLMFDFNVEPGVCAIGQEQLLPEQYEHDVNGRPILSKPIYGTGIIGEVWIPHNSSTPAVCRAILKTKTGEPSRWSLHQGPVRCYGDASGGARGTAKVEGSDWELIEKELRPAFRERLAFRVKPANPPERARINAVNSRLRSTLGDVKLLVDPQAAPHVVEDFEGVSLLKGGSGELDKAKTPKLTHLSDAIGYKEEYEHPVSGPGLIKMRVAGT